MPIEAFFKKLVGLRDRLRVLEQKINSHPELPAEAKLELQGYITRCYGSLTSFNVLHDERTTPYGTGWRGQLGAQVSGGSEQVRYFFSAEYEDEIGHMRLPDEEYTRIAQIRVVNELPYAHYRPNEVKKVSVRTNVNANLSHHADVGATIGLVKSDGRLPQNDNNVTGMLGSGLFGRGYEGTRAFGSEWGVFRPGEVFAVVADQDITRLTTSATANWRPTDFLTGRATVGLDYTNRIDGLFQALNEGPAFLTFAGIDFASSSFWDEKNDVYDYARQGVKRDTGEQIEFTNRLIQDYRLVYAEDPVHEGDFESMAVLTKKNQKTLVTGDDMLVTNAGKVREAVKYGACSGAILKVNQAGSLYDAMKFAEECSKNNIRIITSHRSGESVDSHISHIAVATGSKMIKTGVLGGERVAKLNELVRLTEYDLIEGMAELSSA